MITISSKDQCSGCHACNNVCPQNCIQMKSDDEGFLYPIVDINNCINCNMCVKVCPILNSEKPEGKPKAFACMNKDEDIRLKSSSGGIFSILANEIIKNNGVVFGAGFNEGYEVKHLCIEDVNDLDQLRGSKYVQSTISNTYKKTKDLLEQGRMVLFTGTPCQISGLKSYLNKDYENLITQDIICHGVPSPKVWKKYVAYRENIAGASTCRINFREKDESWNRYSISFLFQNNTEYINKQMNDLYMLGFIQNLYLRPSCYNCNFKTIKRCSDFTLADFWGIDNMLPEMNDEKGTSLVLIHTDKGQKIFNLLSDKLLYKEVDLIESIKSNPSIQYSVNRNHFRDKFFIEIERKPINQVMEMYSSKKIVSRIRRKVSKYIHRFE